MGGVALTFPNACLIVAVSRLRRGRTGVQCHRESSPLTLDAVLLDRHTLIQACVICHGWLKNNVPDQQTGPRHHISHRRSARQSRKIAERHGVVGSGEPFGMGPEKWCAVVEFPRNARLI